MKKREENVYKTLDQHSKRKEANGAAKSLSKHLLRNELGKINSLLLLEQIHENKLYPKVKQSKVFS